MSLPTNFNWRPFVELSRIDRFAGTMILFWPYAWSITMSARQAQVPLIPYVNGLAAGFLGACLLHSGGCVWNDIIDKDIDARVERTKGRPLPKGTLSVAHAAYFLMPHLLGLAVLAHHLNPIAWRMALITVLPLTGLYPFMKRITYWPQAWLGITLNAPVLLASSVLTPDVSTGAMVLAAGGWCWTMWYDTIYGSQDKKDDVSAGVKSIVLLLQQHTKIALSIFAAGLWLSWTICGFMTSSGPVYFVITIGGGGLLLARDLWTVDVDDPKSCLIAFERNGFLIGPVVWSGFLLDYLLS